MRTLNDLKPSVARKMHAAMSTDGGQELVEFITTHLESTKEQLLSTKITLDEFRFKQGVATAYRTILQILATAEEKAYVSEVD